MTADRNQWRAVCGSKTPSATKETPTSSQQDIWAELDTAMYPHEYENLHENSRWANEMKKMREKKY
jgi:hypothetical protein